MKAAIFCWRGCRRKTSTNIFQCSFPTLLQLKSATFLRAEAQEHLLNTLRGDLGHLSANFALRVEAEVPSAHQCATICRWPGLHWDKELSELSELGKKRAVFETSLVASKMAIAKYSQYTHSFPYFLTFSIVFLSRCDCQGYL
jgi:hypothetical protein